MLRFRLVHSRIKSFGLAYTYTKDVWVGQQWDALTEQWEDRTSGYTTSEAAELALLRDFVDVEFDPVFELGE